MFDVKVFINGKEVPAQITATEVRRLMQLVNAESIRERVESFMKTRYPDAADLYGDEYPNVIDTVINRICHFVSNGALSHTAVTSVYIDNVFREKYMPFAEIRRDFYDDEEQCCCIDGWFTDDENEEGLVLARVYADRVEFADNGYSNCLDVLRAIEAVKEEMNS